MTGTLKTKTELQIITEQRDALKLQCQDLLGNIAIDPETCPHPLAGKLARQSVAIELLSIAGDGLRTELAAWEKWAATVPHAKDCWCTVDPRGQAG